MSNRIELLPDAIANQIAAGEVVQRPASVVKEVLENAIDAGATEIELSIQNAGKNLIQIIDNGSGMSETDARMCFERHATSKIKKVDDLFDIHTFGFRGEAMASIGAVARVELKTKEPESDLGIEIVVEDSRVLSQQPIATRSGTCIAVKNLFFNVPARKNFLKSNKVESRHISDEFIRAALSRPDVSLKLYFDNELAYDLKAGSYKRRITQLFGKNYAENLVDINEDSGIVKISGFVATPEMARKTRGDQYFLANGRFIKSPYFNHAVVGAFENLVPDDTYPAYFIKFDLDPARIDVNVHPTKTEVKFEDEKSIYAILASSIRKALNDHHIAPVIDFDQDKANLESWLKAPNTPFSNPTRPSSGGTYTPPVFSKPTVEKGQQSWKSLYEGIEKNAEQNTPSTASFQERNKSLLDIADEKKPFQIANKYLATAIKSGLMLIHQNRAHERILYEKFSESLVEKKSKTQKKLFPEVVQLNANQYKSILSVLEKLNDVGFDLESFGNNAIIVNGMPEEIADDSSELIIRKLADEFAQDDNRDTLSLKEGLAKSLARSTAIKSGKILKTNEATAIIDQLFACKEPYYGIDGRSTLQVLSIDELDAKF